MDYKIKYRLQVRDRYVVFRVLEMDERFRAAGDGVCKCFVPPSPHMRVVSSLCPDLQMEAVYLYGVAHNCDINEPFLKFSTCEEAVAYADKVHKSLKCWAENWDGFKEPRIDDSDDPDIFVV